MSEERGSVKHPRITSSAYPQAHPFRVCVMRTAPDEWAVVRGYRDLAYHPTHAEALADARARTHLTSVDKGE